ncbi:Pancreatic triacylglycerol lipase [Eumeta japonica]|uniref:Pancreatic triacylglycerol lipase n=1 Tax=Eumeta variegata TaxID=151549 RepID=A0A4C1U0X1_EUMVA|nr:Pancreatic triacylglycerol lipase [Eumeta japonica]
MQLFPSEVIYIVTPSSKECEQARLLSYCEGVARFVNWLNSATGATANQYHIVGHSLGGHQAGIVARNVNGNVAYITALDPAQPGWITNDHKLRGSDSSYTEVIHTNAGVLGYLGTLGHTDFYPNGGINMPGCSSQDCDHSRRRFANDRVVSKWLFGNMNSLSESTAGRKLTRAAPFVTCYHYLAESLTSGIFTGRRCATYIAAMTGNCLLWGNLVMGGLVPKTGQSGIYWLETNAAPPFARG